MKITFTITADDYSDAQRAHCASKAAWRWRTRISISLAVLLLAGSILIVALDSENGAMMRPAVIVFGFYLCLFWLRRSNFLRRLQYKKIDSLKRTNTVDIREDGITASTEAARTEIKWMSFIGWYESKSLFLLYQQPRLFNIYPKRAFGPGEVEQFRELLKQKIPSH